MKHSIWKRSLTLVALLCLTLCVAPLAWAQDGDLAPRRIETGWEQIDTHVFQRQLEDGTVETVGWGDEMLAWQLGQVNERIAYLEGLAMELDEPSAELMDSLSFHRARARELEVELASEGQDWMPLQPQSGELRSLAGALGCNLIVTRNASAGPTSTGPQANATASFSDTCNTFGQVRATAYAEGIYNGALRAEIEVDPASGWRSGFGSAAASASATVVATSSCLSFALAEVWILDEAGEWARFFRSVESSECREVELPECLPRHPMGCNLL